MSRSWPTLLMLLAVHLTSGPSPAWADGGDTSLIHACATPVVRGSGAFLRIIGAGDTCPPGQTPVHWPGSIGDDPPPPAAPRFVIRDANGAQVGTFGGFDANSTASTHLSVEGRTFVLLVSRDRVTAAASSALYLGDNCDGTPYLQVFVQPIQPLQPLGRTFTRTDVGPPFDVVVQADPTEAPVERDFSSFREVEGACNPTDLPDTLSVTATTVTLNPLPPFSVTLE